MYKLRNRILILLFCFVFLFILVLFPFIIPNQNRGNKQIVVGSKNFTEGHILSEMLALLLEENLHFTVTRKFQLDGTFICFNALKSHSIDLYTEYTGGAILSILKGPPISNPIEAYEFVKKEFEEKFAITWLPGFGFYDSYCLIMQRKKAEALGISDLSSFSAYLKRKGMLRIAYDPEFVGRLEKKVLDQEYEIEYREEPLLMDHSLLYLTMRSDAIDVIDGYATDGFIISDDLLVLKDDKQKLPSYYGAPVVRMDILEKYPEVGPELSKLAGRITCEKMQELNFLVEVEGKKINEVARAFLIEEKLI